MSHREPVTTEGEPTIGKLVVDASRDVSALVKHEIELAKSELKVSVKAGGISIGLFAAAGFLVLLGLVLGKPVGVLGGAWLLTRFTRAELNEGLLWRDLFGVAIVAGVGFTVSLLVSDLAFTGEEREQAKTAVLLGSLLAGLAAALVLGRRNRRHRGA